MSTSPNITRSEIACKLRSLAAEWREGKEPDIMMACYAIFCAFGVIQCSMPLALEIIAAYVDPEGEIAYHNDEIEKFISGLDAFKE